MTVPIYVLSLSDEVQRRKNIKKQLEDLNLSFIFVDAVDFRNTNNSSVQRYIKDMDVVSMREMVQGEIGCALSHQLIYKQISENLEGDVALILEDDAIIDRQLKSFIKRIDTVHVDWDIIILGYSKLARERQKTFYLMEPIKKLSKIDNVYLGKVWREWTCGTVGYLITKRAAQKFIKNNIISLADDFAVYQEKMSLNILHARPTLVLEDFHNYPSSLEQDRSKLLKKTRHYLFFLRLLRGMIRKLFMQLTKNRYIMKKNTR